MNNNFKKALALPMLMLLLTGCNNQSVNPVPVIKDKVDLFSALSHENLRADYNYYAQETYQNRGYSLNFDCLKNEYDAAQIIMRAREHVASFDVELNDLTDNNGHTLSKDNFEVLVAWYKNVRTSVESTTIFKRGYYPDALIPIEQYKLRRKDFIEAERNQALYFNFKSPKDAVSGTYNGMFKIIVDGYEYEIPVSVNIHKGELSDENHLKSSFLIWYDQIPIGEKENTTEQMNLAYYDTVVSKRLAPDMLPPSLTSNPINFANSVYEKVAKNPAVTAHRMPITYMNFSEVNVRAYMEALVAKQKAIIESGDNETILFEKLYFYIDDEPSPDDYAKVRSHDALIYKLKKEYAAQFTQQKIKDAILKMNNVVTTAFNESLIATKYNGGVQTWCPQFQNFQSQENRNKYKYRQSTQLREGGENVWWYGCLDPKGYYPSYHLDATTVYSRALPYMQYAYGIEAELYWSVCYYSKYDVSGTVTSRDIWYDPISWAGCAGDGQLLYPGYDYGLDHPISTQRLENILAGREEYEYLYMLQNYVEQYNAAKGTNYNLNSMLSNLYATFFTGVQPKHDSSLINNARMKLLEAFDKFDESLESGVNYLLSLGE